MPDSCRLETRKIIHIDMDYFYAQVEELENPDLKNHPVAIGGPSRTQGVLCTANYQARSFGIRSGQSTFEACKRCPELVLIYPNFQKYKQISKILHAIYQRYTNKIQLVALDEAYLDVSDQSLFQGSATLIAQAIQQDIYEETGLTCSAGVSVNKMLAKIASDWNKPHGLFTVTPQEQQSFMKQVPLRKIPGVGKVTLAKLEHQEIQTTNDILTANQQLLIQILGEKKAVRLLQNCQGVCDQEVIVNRQRKSISCEKTYYDGLADKHIVEEARHAVESLQIRLREVDDFHFHQRQMTGITLKLKSIDFQTSTKAIALDTFEARNLLESKELQDPIRQRIYATFKQWSPFPVVRLIGLGIRLQECDSDQMELFH